MGAADNKENEQGTSTPGEWNCRVGIPLEKKNFEDLKGSKRPKDAS